MEKIAQPSVALQAQVAEETRRKLKIAAAYTGESIGGVVDRLVADHLVIGEFASNPDPGDTQEN